MSKWEKPFLEKIRELLKQGEFIQEDLKTDYIELMNYLKDCLINNFFNDVKIIQELQKIYISNIIPQKKIIHAIHSYEHDIKKDSLIGLIDLTIFNSGRKGFVFTDKKMYYSLYSKQWSIDYSDIQYIRIIHTNYVIFHHVEIMNKNGFIFEAYCLTTAQVFVFFFIQNILGVKNIII